MRGRLSRRGWGMLALLLSWPVAAPAVAGSHPGRDDCAPCTRHRRAEWGPEFRRAKRLEHLDCHGLAADAEGQRFVLNSQVWGVYQRPMLGPVAPAPAPAPIPLLSPPSFLPGFGREDKPPIP